MFLSFKWSVSMPGKYHEAVVSYITDAVEHYMRVPGIVTLCVLEERRRFAGE